MVCSGLQNGSLFLPVASRNNIYAARVPVMSMRRKIEWVDRQPDGQKRKVRVTFPGAGRMRWQVKASGADDWCYEITPSRDDLQMLEDRLDALYRRRRVPYKYVELAQQARRRLP